jgi:hypothetical protein
MWGKRAAAAVAAAVSSSAAAKERLWFRVNEHEQSTGIPLKQTQKEIQSIHDSLFLHLAFNT